MRSKERRFIPLTLNYEGKKAFSDAQILIAIVCVAVSAIGMIICFTIYGNHAYDGWLGTYLFLIPAIALCIYVPLLVIRKFAFKENSLKKLYANMKKFNKTSIIPFWDVFDIDGHRIMYIDGSVGVLLKIVRGYSTGRDPDHEDLHYEKTTEFLGQLLGNGYYVQFYDLEECDANTAPLDELEVDLQKMRDQTIYDVGTSFVKYFRELGEKNGIGESEYYLVRARTLESITHIDKVINDAILKLRGSLYVDCCECGYSEYMKFVRHYYNLSHIDTNTLMNLRYAEIRHNLVQVVKLLKVGGDQQEAVAPVVVADDSSSYEFEAMMQDYDDAKAVEHKKPKSQGAPVSVITEMEDDFEI